MIEQIIQTITNRKHAISSKLRSDRSGLERMLLREVCCIINGT